MMNANMRNDDFTDDGPDETGVQEAREYIVYVTVTYSGWCGITASSADAARAIVLGGNYGDSGLQLDVLPDELNVDSVEEN